MYVTLPHRPFSPLRLTLVAYPPSTDTGIDTRQHVAVARVVFESVAPFGRLW